MKVKFNISNVEKALVKSYTKKINDREELFIKDVLEVCKLLNRDLSKNNHKHLDLSDKRFKEVFNFEPRKSKRIRQKLQTIGAIKINEIIVDGKKVVQRQTGQGSYPNWVPAFNKELKLVKITEEEKKTRISTPVEKIYKKVYCTKWHATIAEYRELGLFEVAPIGYAMAIIHTEMNEWMAHNGWTREDLKL